MYDIAIIGAGPAGSTLARLVGNHFKTVIIDRRPFDRKESAFPTKCCGGLLAPDAQKVIAEMGLCVGNDILTSPQLFAVRAIDIERNIEQYYQRFYININRERFDRWLFSMIPDTVDIIPRTLFKGFVKNDNHFKIHCTSGNKNQTIKARKIIAADGATSLVRKILNGNRQNIRTYVSIQEWFKCKNPVPYYAALFDSSITDFYSWIIPKDDHILLGTAVPVFGSDSSQRFDSLKKKSAAYGYNLTRPVRREGTLIYRPRPSQIHTGDNDIAFIGEAGGFISPSSAEGFSYAFRSAIALAESLIENFDAFERSYRHKTAVLKRNIALKNIKAPAMYNPLLRRIIMRSGIQTIHVK
jgi:flavin-dependent dehydrogenase